VYILKGITFANLMYFNNIIKLITIIYKNDIIKIRSFLYSLFFFTEFLS